MKALWLNFIDFFKKKHSQHNYLKVMNSSEDRRRIDMLRFKSATKIIRHELENKNDKKNKTILNTDSIIKKQNKIMANFMDGFDAHAHIAEVQKKDLGELQKIVDQRLKEIKANSKKKTTTKKKATTKKSTTTTTAKKKTTTAKKKTTTKKKATK